MESNYMWYNRQWWLWRWTAIRSRGIKILSRNISYKINRKIFSWFSIFIFYYFQTYSKIQLVTMFIKGVPPIIFALFIGPWSDNHGRKVLIILPLVGFILNYLWFLINTIYYEELVVEYLMFEVIATWFGGWTCFFLGTYSYISDLSTSKSRALRIGILDCVSSAATAIALGIISIFSNLLGSYNVHFTNSSS